MDNKNYPPPNYPPQQGYSQGQYVPPQQQYGGYQQPQYQQQYQPPQPQYQQQQPSYIPSTDNIAVEKINTKPKYQDLW